MKKICKKQKLGLVGRPRHQEPVVVDQVRKCVIMVCCIFLRDISCRMPNMIHSLLWDKLNGKPEEKTWRNLSNQNDQPELISNKS